MWILFSNGLGNIDISSLKCISIELTIESQAMSPNWISPKSELSKHLNPMLYFQSQIPLSFKWKKLIELPISSIITALFSIGK